MAEMDLLKRAPDPAVSDNSQRCKQGNLLQKFKMENDYRISGNLILDLKYRSFTIAVWAVL